MSSIPIMTGILTIYKIDILWKNNQKGVDDVMGELIGNFKNVNSNHV